MRRIIGKGDSALPAWTEQQKKVIDSPAGRIICSAAAGSGKIAYFCFADEEHGAVWTAEKSWTGDAWSDGVGCEADEKMLFGN